MRAFPTIPARPSNICYCGGRYAHAHAAPPAPDARLREALVALRDQCLSKVGRMNDVINAEGGQDTEIYEECLENHQKFADALSTLLEASLRAHEGTDVVERTRTDAEWMAAYGITDANKGGEVNG
jgi:hypothetical protein